jgi:CRISPR system Cascade subunit CasE
MSIVLSRIQLNPFSRRAMLLAADPTVLHRSLYSLFDKGESGRILFRVDTDTGGPTVLLQSGVRPFWDRLELSHADLRSAPQSKEVDVAPALGTELAFRLTARPSRAVSGGAGSGRGKRTDLRTDEERIDWLKRKGEASGFKVTSCGLTILALAAIKSPIPFDKNSGYFCAVRFDGELVVTDPGKLRDAVENGIGTQKAFGFGLLSLGGVGSQ